MTLLEINDLSIEYETDNGTLQAVDEVSLSMESGETLGLVGESGCGKSTAAKSLIGLLDSNGRITNGEIIYDSRDLTTFSEDELREIRWTDISYIPQNAMNALDPVHRIGSQMVEVIQTHTDFTKRDARDRAKELLEDVDLNPNRINDYPHELSGGQRQRVVIAISLALTPSIIIADEPTTGLDVVVQDGILNLIQRIQNERDISMLIITHDMSVIAEVTDRTGVMYGGQLVEIGDTQRIFYQTAHPYTIGLSNAFPSLDQDMGELVHILGSPPDLRNPPSGCRFKDRCPFSTLECQEEPPLRMVNGDHAAKCHYVEDADEFRDRGRKSELWLQEGSSE